MIPGVKSLLYIGSSLAVWQVNVKEEKLIVKEVIPKKKREKGGGGLNVIYPGICHKLNLCDQIYLWTIISSYSVRMQFQFLPIHV